MCGIFCCIYKRTSSRKDEKSFSKGLSHRGPDLSSEKQFDLHHDWVGRFSGHVLWMQGQKPTVQPICDEDDNLLLWNGDILSGSLDSECLCDTEMVFSHFKQNKKQLNLQISLLCGPYAFIFWDNESKYLWFGRDAVGRHSLLWNIEDSSVIVTSVGHKDCKLTEVPATGIFMIDFSRSAQVEEINFFPWSHLIHLEIETELKISLKNHPAISHSIIEDGTARLSWLCKEPSEDEISIYNNFIKGTEASVIMNTLLQEASIISRVDSFLNILLKSVKVRVRKQPNVCKKCLSKSSCQHCVVGVLFSGGLDSTVLALLCDKFVPGDQPIDLYNVAFERPSNNTAGFNVPDRKTGESSLFELKKLAPCRTWNFVKIDVTQEELLSCRKNIISHLIHPLDSVLDDSLGCALWFAARGIGTLDGVSYTSPARVAILGMGADEQLGGYMRHRTTFNRCKSWREVSKQLCSDTDAISRRNLGRDNRVVCDHGRQPRMPYLDEYLISYVNSLPPWHRCMLIPEMPSGVGDKLLLRLVAWRLGLCNAALLPKRALQFGSRIANSKEKGFDTCHRLN